MICTATINGIPVEIHGTPEECYRFFTVGKDNACKPTKKVCDPMARHIGNCGAEDCPIIPAPRPTHQVSVDGMNWIDWFPGSLFYGDLSDYKYNRALCRCPDRIGVTRTAQGPFCPNCKGYVR